MASTAYTMQRHTLFLWVLLLTLLCLSCFTSSANAFGAGNIPGFSYLEGKAFRHGDIDDTIGELAKKAGGLLGMSSKFSGLDVKRIYLGSFLADYSQAMDVGSLEKLPKQSILNIIMVMGFMAFGYATQEFEITMDRLGVYSPTEHIDNPKGYAEGKDARQLDARLRGPVRDVEMEIDPRSGMKNYIANETGDWDTSSALVRHRLIECIENGRRARASGDEKTLFEAYRQLGRCLHTLEDFPAHSNFCELALQRTGHRAVFCHVGDNVKVRAPDGTQIAPLVTGTFGGADFVHSLLGEAQDHLSEASVSDLHRAVRDARSSGSSPVSNLLGLLQDVPGGSTGNLSRDAEQLSQGPSRDPATMDPKEIYNNLFRILSFRDSVMMSIEKTVDRIPGLNSLIEKIGNSVSVFVYTLLEPYVQPIVKQALSGLQTSSAQIINNEDQFQVFNDPNASDPTHSMLSKDHFGLVLNEVAGNLGLIIVRHCVPLVVKAWDDQKMDARQVADECLAVLFHPFWYNVNHCHPVQSRMMGFVEEWGRNNRQEVAKLDREHVRSHRNTRSGKAEVHSHGGPVNQFGVPVEGQQGVQTGTGMAHQFQGYVGNKIQHAMGGGMGGMGGGMFREAGPEGDGGQQPHDSGPRPGHYHDQPHSTGQSAGYYNDSQPPRNEQQYGGGPPPGRYDYQQPPYNNQPYGGGQQQPQYGAPGYGPPPGQDDGRYGAPPQFGGPQMPQPDGYGNQPGGPGYGPPQGPPPPQQWGPPPPQFPNPGYGYQNQPPQPPPGSGYY